MMSRTDIIVLLCSIGLVASLYANFWGTHRHGDSADIYVGGQRILHASLLVNRTYTIQGKLGPSLIEVKNGRIHFSQSPCTSKQCIHSGWLDQGGDFAACLPNQVSIALRSPDPRFDSINF